MSRSDQARVLMIGVAKAPVIPWWWKHVDQTQLGWQLQIETIQLAGGRPASPFSWPFISMCLQVIRIILRARSTGVHYVFTFECDWLSFIIGGLQTLLMFRTPRHVIVQFIMREKTGSLRSRLKYAFMKCCFASVYKCICSSRKEAEYYMKAFGWPAEKVAYVPFHTDPAFVERALVPEENFMLSAGRTFRDYPTLLEAFSGLDVPLTIVAGRASTNGCPVPPHVTALYDIPLPDLINLMARSRAVVLSLQDREISVGQSVLLEAMAMGKPVITTSVNGTIDYIEHMKTGILVPPRDPRALREAIELLADNSALRAGLGEAGRQQVLREHLPSHYFLAVSKVLGTAS